MELNATRLVYMTAKLKSEREYILCVKKSDAKKIKKANNSRAENTAQIWSTALAASRCVCTFKPSRNNY